MKKIIGILLSAAFLLVPFSAVGSTPARLVTTEIKFFDGFGRDFESGNLTWESVDGLSRSSIQITPEVSEIGELTATLTVPAKDLYLHLSNFITADGYCVQGQGTFFPSQGERNFVLPAYEDPVEHKVKVKLPGGHPVPNAIVSARMWLPYNEFQDENFTGFVSGTLAPNSSKSSLRCSDVYEIHNGTWTNSFPTSWMPFDGKRDDGVKIRDVTNKDGIATLKGWDMSWDPNDPAVVEATYDDGVIYQRTGFTRIDNSKSTVLKLDYLPVVVYSSGDIDAYLNDLVELPISVIDPPEIEPAFAKPNSLSPKRAQFQGIGKAASVFPGIQVEVTAPAFGSSKACPKKQLLKAKTNSKGQAKLKVCARVSGIYTVKAKGAVGISSVLIRVKGAPPMAPNSLSASTGVKRATVAWGLPTYAGGAPILKYVVTATAPGQKTKKVEVKSGSSAFKSKKIYLTGLAAPKRWQISVVAVTKHGEGEKSNISVKVPIK